MGKTTIEWTDYVFNPWWGCVKVSPGCQNCYAATFDRFVHGTSRHVTAKGEVREPHWGKDAPRRFFGDKHWAEPLKWNRDAEKAGERRRVFCASMADVFEDREDLRDQRDRLFALIHATPHLDWLLLTKRPERVMEIVPESWCDGFPRNVWLGTTCEDPQRADERIPHLLAVPAAVRFLSVEPMLGPVDLRPRLPRSPESIVRTIDWVIVGGESGPGARPCDVAWIRSVRDQCQEAGVACFVKQAGAYVTDRNDAGFDANSEFWADGPDAGQPTNPTAWPEPVDVKDDEYQGHQGARVRVVLADPKGGDMAEWPADLRVREFPMTAKEG